MKKMINKTKKYILDLAIEAFKENISLPAEFKIGYKERAANNIGFDKLLKLKINRTELTFCAEVETGINKATIGLLVHKKNYMPHPPILITKYINNIAAEKLRKLKVQFIDTAGNVYIDNFPLYIFIKGNKPIDVFIKNRAVRAFKPAGLKMIFALLKNQDLVKKPYRDIANEANVALGTVGFVINDLKELGFLVDMGKIGKKLINRDKLFNRWCTEYTERLRLKLFIGKFGGPSNWWKDYAPDPEYAQWGGEVAAAKVTGFLKPQDIILYVKRDDYNNILLENRLYQDPEGNTQLLEKFWGPYKTNKLDDTVHPILIYADLVGTGDERNIEAARIIYERHIDRYLREDR